MNNFEEVLAKIDRREELEAGERYFLILMLVVYRTWLSSQFSRISTVLSTLDEAEQLAFEEDAAGYTCLSKGRQFVETVLESFTRKTS